MHIDNTYIRPIDIACAASSLWGCQGFISLPRRCNAEQSPTIIKVARTAQLSTDISNNYLKAKFTAPVSHCQ